MNAARVRIGRVTMKAGGADIRVITRPAQNDVTRKIVRWSRRVIELDPPPDAFFAIALYVDPSVPGGVSTNSDWESRHPAFPIILMPTLAIELARWEIEAVATTNEVLETLGYTQGDPAG